MDLKKETATTKPIKDTNVLIVPKINIICVFPIACKTDDILTDEICIPTISVRIEKQEITMVHCGPYKIKIISFEHM